MTYNNKYKAKKTVVNNIVFDSRYNVPRNYYMIGEPK